MNIRDEEQLQQYFERQMTSGEEQNFLINVAARDDMRLAFRSQLELLKAVREDKDASGSPAFVRSKTLGALGLGGALVPGSLKEHEAQAASFKPTILEKIGTAFKRPAISIATGLIAGVLGTSFLLQSSTNETLRSPVHEVIQAPPVQQAPLQVTPAVSSPSENRMNKSHRTYKAYSPAKNAATSTEIQQPVVTKTNPITVESKTKIHKPDESGTK